MAVQIGPKIGIEGEKEYRSQIQQIIQQTKTLDSAMERTSSTWTKNTSQMAKNKAQAQYLQQSIGLMRDKLSVMNTMLEQSTAKYGENASATLAWQRAVDSTTASLNMMEQELSQLGNAGNFSDLSTKFADFGTKMQNIGGQMQSIGTKMTAGITVPLAAAGAAAIKLASDTEEASSKVDVVFGNMSTSVKQFADDALNSYGLAEGTALQMTGTFGAMATSMGLSQQVAASMSIALTGLAADMASFYNVSTEVAQTSLQGVFTGETEALKKFGIVMTQTNLEDFAAQQGKVYSKMSETEKVMTRYAYVMDATKDAQGDFARTSNGTANSLRVFQESLKELGAAFGEALLPMITPVVQAITRVIQALAKLPAPIQRIIAIVALIVAAIGPLILIIGSLMIALGGIITQAPVVVAALGSIASALVATEIAGLPLLAFFGALAAAIAVGAAIGVGLAANWDSIAEAVRNLGNKLSNAVNNINTFYDTLARLGSVSLDKLVSEFKALPAKVVQAIREAAEGVKKAFNEMIENAKQSGRHMIEGFVDGIKQRVQKVVDAVKKVANSVKDYLGFTRPDKGPLHEYEQWMPHFMQGLAKGIRGNMGIVKSAMNGVAKEMAIPLSSNATMNMAMASADGSMSIPFGESTMNVYVDHISELSDLIRIQNQAQQMSRMGAR